MNFGEDREPTLYVNPAMSIGKLRQRIMTRYITPGKHPRITHNGRVLDDDEKSLKDCVITKNSNTLFVHEVNGSMGGGGTTFSVSNPLSKAEAGRSKFSLDEEKDIQTLD